MLTCSFCSSQLTNVRISTSEPFLCICFSCFNPLVVKKENGVLSSVPLDDWQDLRKTWDRGSLGGQLLQSIAAEMDSIPALPEIAHQILDKLRDPEADATALANLIEKDPVITMKILQVANSALFGGLSEVKSLQAACARLGMRTIGEIVLAVANGKLYVTKEPAFKAKMHQLWRHAVATAVAAGEINRMLARPGHETYFIAGLLHDIGKVVILDVVTNAVSVGKNPAFSMLSQSPKLLDEIIEQCHNLVGLMVLQGWSLPNDFGIAAFCHENPYKVPHESWLFLSHTIALASEIANHAGFNSKGENSESTSLVTLPSTKFLGLRDIQLAAIRVALEDSVQVYMDASL